MNSGKRPLGYTIVEVMIVLAASSLMFLLAANFISGKQARTAFTAGVNEMASRLQDTIEQVSDGKYSDIPLACTFDGTDTHIAAGTAAQGTEDQCVFLGKVLHFSESNTWPSGDDAYHYEVFSIAGGRVSTDVAHTALTTPAEAGAAVASDLTTQQTISQSLAVKSVTVNGTTAESYGIGFFQGQGSNESGSLVSGVSSVKMYYVDTLLADKDTGTATGLIKGSTNNLKEAQSINICLTDGSQFAEVILGSNQNQLNVEVKRTGLSASCS